jgi:hypothetical protein
MKLQNRGRGDYMNDKPEIAWQDRDYIQVFMNK